MKPAAYTDEEWEIEMLINESEHVCASCAEDIHTVDELMLIQVVYPTVGVGGLSYCVIENDEGEFQYQPYFFHIDCWESLEEDLRTDVEDTTPPEDPQYEKVVCSCWVCAATIRTWETSGLVNFGELRRSQRLPNGERTLYFDNCNTQPRVLCISCLAYFNENIIEMWPTVEHNGECEPGLQQRCWRDGQCLQGCKRLWRAAE